jgi:poly-beta-1,6-N-acetyl-D-glucosamine synthase
MRAFDLLSSLGINGVAYFAWYAMLFLAPCYYIGPMLVPIAMLWKISKPRIRSDLSVSVILAANNEERGLRKFAQSVAEQTIRAEGCHIELIVVDDGSTDRTTQVARELVREGKIDKALKLDQRGGKAAALHLALTECTGDIIIAADADTTFDRDAFAEMLVYFDDPRVGAVSCTISPINADTNLITRYQAIEYAFIAYLRLCVSSALGMMPLVIGAFYACRRTAIEQVGRHDPHLVEDVDLALKLRRAGWRVAFAPEARALTGVPKTITAFIAQRLRWDQGLISLWARKAVVALDPRDANFSFVNALVLIGLLFFDNIMSTAILLSLAVLIYSGGEFGLVFLATIFIIESICVFFTFIAAAVEEQVPFSFVIYLPYFMAQMFVMRIIRMFTVIWELIFFSSLKNAYIPARVRSQMEVS